MKRKLLMHILLSLLMLMLRRKIILSLGAKKGKEGKTHKKRLKEEIQIVENLDEVKKPEKSKSKEHKAKGVAVEKDPNVLECPPTAFRLFLETFRKDYNEANLDSENIQRINKVVVKTWKSMTDEDKKSYLDKAAKLKEKYEKLKFTGLNERFSHSNRPESSSGKCTSPRSNKAIDGFQERRIGKRERKPKVHFD